MKHVTYIYEWSDVDNAVLFSHTVDAVLIDDYTIINMVDSGQELEVTRSKHPITVEAVGIVRHTGDMDIFTVVKHRDGSGVSKILLYT